MKRGRESRWRGVRRKGEKMEKGREGEGRRKKRNEKALSIGIGKLKIYPEPRPECKWSRLVGGSEMNRLPRESYASAVRRVRLLITQIRTPPPPTISLLNRVLFPILNRFRFDRIVGKSSDNRKIFAVRTVRLATILSPPPPPPIFSFINDEFFFPRFTTWS